MKRARQMAGDDADSVLARCLVQDIPDADSLLHAVAKRVPVSLEKARQAGQGGGVRLIVIDSIAAVLRGDEDLDASLGRDAALARAKFMYELSAALKSLCAQWHVAVLVLNQATALVEDDAPPPPQSAVAAYHQVTDASGARPALGMVWSHCVNARIILSRSPPQSAVPWGYHALLPALPHPGPSGGHKRPRSTASPGAPLALPESAPGTPSASLHAGLALEGQREGSPSEDLPRTALRYARVEFAPWCASAEALYVITQSGVRGVALAK